MPLSKAAEAIRRKIEEGNQELLNNKIPAGAIRDQVHGETLPPATGSKRGGVMLSDATPAATGVASAGTSAAASRGDHVHSSSGGSAITIEEVDGTPTEAAPTKLKFPNGTLSVSSHEVTYTPAGGGGGGNITSTGATGSEPGSPSAGDLYLPNNGFVVERYSGSAWAHWGPIFPLTDPAIAAPTTWVNQGSASVAAVGGGITLTDPASGGTSANGKLRKKAAPSTPYTITALFLPTFVGVDFMSGGLCFRQSSDGKLIYFKMQYNSFSAPTFLLAVVSASSPTAEVANLRSVPLGGSTAHVWLQIADDSTNRVYRYSLDGQNFIDIYSELRTTYLTADEVGYFIDSRNATYAAALTLLSWKEA